MRIDPDRTLRTMIPGSTNQRAIDLVRCAVGRSVDRPNPLLIRGPSGVGKSHLLHAAANELVRHHPSFTVRALTAEVFVNNYIASIRGGWVDAFRHTLTSDDALLVDELEDLADRPSWLQELTRTIRVFVESGRPVLLATELTQTGLVESDVRKFPLGAITTLRKATIQQRLAALRGGPHRKHMTVASLTVIARRSKTIPEARAALERAVLQRDHRRRFST